VEDCTVEGCQLIRAGSVPGASCLFHRVTFRWGAGTGEFPSGSWWDQCLFDGAGAGGYPHALFLSGADRCLVTSCDVRGTARGLVVQGRVRGCLVVGNRFTGATGGAENAGEVIGLETQDEIAWNFFLWNHIEGCSGPGISLQGGGIHDNGFQGRRLGCRALSIYLAQNGPAPIERNFFAELECDGGVWLEGDCRANAFAGVVVRDLPGSSGNQPPFGEFYGRPPFVDRSGKTGADANTFAGCCRADRDGTLRPAAVEVVTVA
jgi:hypothetical protein